MLEFCRFFSDHADKKSIKLADTPFGHTLAARGVSKKDIAALAKNPLLGKEGAYAFNLTEEKNADAAAGLLADMVNRAAA
jgi:hypothetical protein